MQHVHETGEPVPLMSVDDVTGDLVRAARDGDREAFGLLAERNWHHLVRLARSVVGELGAEDAVQDGLVAAWGRLGSLTDPDRFDAWVSRIVFRRCLRATRRQRGRVSLDAVPEAGVGCDPAASLSAWQLLSRLAPRQRAVLHLTVVEGMTDAEIAPLLSITPAPVARQRVTARLPLAREPIPWLRLAAGAALVIVLVVATWVGAPRPAREGTVLARGGFPPPVDPNVVVWVLDTRTTVYFVLGPDGSAKGGVS